MCRGVPCGRPFGELRGPLFGHPQGAPLHRSEASESFDQGVLSMNSDYIMIVAAMGLVTFLPRWLPLFFLTRYRLSGWFVEWLELLPASILAAILLPALITRGAPRHLEVFTPEMWVAIPTLGFALLTKSLGGTVIVGMLLIWLGEKFIFT